MYNKTVAGMMLICAVLLGAGSALAAEKDCRLKRYAEFDLAQYRTGHLLVPVAIGDTPAYMVLNMGNSYSTVTEDAAKHFGLQVKPALLGTRVRAGQEDVRSLATVKGFSLAGLKFGAVEFMVISGVFLDSGNAPVIGVLGMDALATFDVELDAANRKMGLFSQDHCAGHAVYWAKEFDSVPIRFGALGEFYFPMTLEGKKLETSFTGNLMTTLSTDATRKYYHFDEHSPDVQTEINGTSSYRAMKLSGDGIEIVNARIRLVDGPTELHCHLTSRLGAVTYEGCNVHPLNLGLDVLKQLHIYIATKEKVLYFTSSNPEGNGAGS